MSVKNFDYFFEDLYDLLNGKYVEYGDKMPLQGFRVRQNENEYEILCPVPGMNKDEITITSKDGVIHVSGKNNKTKDYIFTQDFEFDKEMPVDAKLCASKASVKDGVLFINIPKERKKEHNIPID